MPDFPAASHETPRIARILRSKSLWVMLILVFAAAALAVGYRSYVILTPSLAPQEIDTTTFPFFGKRVVYVDSYHAGYEWSDGIEQGITGVLQGTGIDLKIVHLDTKRNPSPEFAEIAGRMAKRDIDAFRPHVLIVADDNAFKYVVMPFYRNVALPVVFAGLNWDAGVYGAPYSNTTGMVEVSLTLQIIEHLKLFARGERIGYLSADTETERKNLQYYEQLFGLTFDKVHLVKTFEEWKEAYRALQEEVDLVIFENNAGITDWNDAAAAAFAQEVIKVPVGTTNSWTISESLLGIAKVPEEQGVWSAQAALRLLRGESVKDIPLAKNRQGSLMINLGLANTLGVVIPPALIKSADVIE